jgi:NAD(P)-dependent dehydrogenase (short-subunit alcohol dehydrogenase family)
LGATVVATARSTDKGEAALARIRAAVPEAQITLELCDFSSQKSIRAFAGRVAAGHPKIHVLVNNAGALVPERHITDDGLELTFAANHIGYFLTTTLLLENIKAAAPARIVSVASGAHSGRVIRWDDLDASMGYSAIERYGMSKLANVMFSYELARRLEGTGVTSNSLHPGVVGTNFGSAWGFIRFGMRFVRPFLLNAEQGAATQIYLATSPEVEGVSGKYFAKKKPKESSRVSRDEPEQRRLWGLSEELVRRSL